jgi:hypothetical protein
LQDVCWEDWEDNAPEHALDLSRKLRSGHDQATEPDAGGDADPDSERDADPDAGGDAEADRVQLMNYVLFAVRHGCILLKTCEVAAAPEATEGEAAAGSESDPPAVWTKTQVRPGI